MEVRHDYSCCSPKAWTAIDSPSVIWKSDMTMAAVRQRHGQLSIAHRSYGRQTWPIKWNGVFFQAAVVLILLYGCTARKLTKRLEKKLEGNYTRILRSVLNKSWRQHLTKQQFYGHLTSIKKLSKLDKPDMWDTDGKVRTNS